MEKLILTILHKLPNRVRIKTSKEIKNKEKFCNFVKENNETIRIRYNNISNTILVTFDPQEILLQEIVYRLTVAFSIENGLEPVKLVEDLYKERPLGSLSMYSAGSIILTSLHNFFDKENKELQYTLNNFSMILTTLAIAEHGYTETKRKGFFDVEIIPALYLIKSFLENNSISIVNLIWLTSFGRHLFNSYENTKNIKVFRIYNPKNKDYIYSIETRDDKSINNLGDFINRFFIKNDTNSSKQNDKYMIISKK